MMTAMNKKELIETVSTKAQITKAQAHEVVDAVLDSITEGLVSDGKVIIPGFGSFEIRTRAAREGRNPRTGEAIKIEESRLPAFKPGKSLKDEVAANAK